MTDLIKIIHHYNQWIRNTVSMKMWEDKIDKWVSTRSFSRLPEFARNKRNPEIPTKEWTIHKNSAPLNVPSRQHSLWRGSTIWTHLCPVNHSKPHKANHLQKKSANLSKTQSCKSLETISSQCNTPGNDETKNSDWEEVCGDLSSFSTTTELTAL